MVNWGGRDRGKSGMGKAAKMEGKDDGSGQGCPRLGGKALGSWHLAALALKKNGERWGTKERVQGQKGLMDTCTKQSSNLLYSTPYEVVKFKLNQNALFPSPIFFSSFSFG